MVSFYPPKYPSLKPEHSRPHPPPLPHNPPPCLQIPPTRATAPHPGMHRKPPHAEPRRQPHKHKHLDADLDVDVELALRLGGVLERDADGRAHHARREHDHHLEERDHRQRQAPPPRPHRQRGQEHQQEPQHRAGQEETKHDLRRDTQHGQDGDDLGRQGDGRAREQLVHEDLDRVEPVEGLGRGAKGDTLVEVPFAKGPEADLVEVVQADGLGDAVDQGGVGDRGGDDVGEVELEEV